jgi:hypothetical protein
MKQAEALILRADMNKKIASLTERINGNCKVQEGEEPGEDPQELLIDTFRILQEHEQLVCKINLANVTTKLPNGKTMMELIDSSSDSNSASRLLTDGPVKVPSVNASTRLSSFR